MTEQIDRTVTANGHRLHYVAAGDPDAPALLLLHGGIIDAARVTWGGVIDPLAEDYRVIALDMLGYGESDAPAGPYPLRRHVEVVADFADAVDLAPATIVGHSLGGGVALGVALERPDLVERVVAGDAYGLGRTLPNGPLTYLLARAQVFNRVAIALFRRSRELTRASLAGIVHDLDALDPAAVDAVWREAKRPKAGVAFRGFRDAEVTRDGYRTVLTPRLSELDVPALFYHGDHDDVFPLRWSERAAARTPDAGFERLAGCAHWAPRERPGAVLSLIRDFAP